MRQSGLALARFKKGLKLAMSNASKAVPAAVEKTPARAWAVLAVTYLACVAAPMSQFKIPPLADYIIPMLIHQGVDPASVGAYFGMLMTCMTIIGAILAFPAAFICRRFGLKGTMLFSVACLAVGGCLAAALGTSNMAVLYVSRIIEGVGIGLVGVAGPTCVSIWFPERTRGRALGIWATWVPVGCVSMFLVAPYVAIAFGFESVFWATGIISVIAFVAFALVFKYPEVDNFGGDPRTVNPSEGMAAGSWRDAMGLLKNKYIWLLGLVFFCFTFNTLGIVNTYYNTFLTLHGFDSAIASNITSVVTGVGIVTAPLSGLIFDKLKREHKRFLVAGILTAIMVSVVFMWTSGGEGSPETGVVMTGAAWVSLAVFLALQSICGGAGGGGMRPLAPMVMAQSAMGATMGMAVLQFMQNLGAGLGSVIYGSVIDMTNVATWALPGNLIQIPVCIVAIVAALMINPWKKKAAASEEVVAGGKAAADKEAGQEA